MIMIMKKISLFLLVFVVSFVFAQNYKVVYQVSWKPSKEKDSVYTDLSVLVIDENKSYFSGYNTYYSDSLKTNIVDSHISNSKDGSLRIPDSKKSLFRKIILKNIASDSIIQEEKFYTTTFHIQSSCKPKWKLHNEETLILGYKAKKASTEFRGRKWSAWYATEIPISDGPYKFYGLPGLILKISDEKEDYIFEAKGITNGIVKLHYRHFGLPNPVLLTEKKWFDFYKKYQKHPSIVLENLNTSSTTFVINGKEIDRDIKKEYDEREKKYLKDNNNEIELNSSCL